MRAASVGHIRVQKIKNLLFKNLNDAHIILMPVFATQLVNKVKMEQIIVFMRNLTFTRVSHRSENFGVQY